MDERIKLVTNLVKEAGDLILEGIKNHSVTSEVKDDTSFVTEWDKKTEKFFINKIQENFPQDGFIGEEGSDIPSGSGFKWVIDPIDGTTNFSKNQPLWAISVALVSNNDVVGAVIYSPVLDKLYTAKKGAGVYSNNVPLHISKVDSLEKSLISYEIPSRPHLREINLKLYPIILNNTSRIRMLGMAAYDLTQVAAGHIDLYLSIGQKSWDTAAGVLMIREAGGSAVDINGQEWTLESESVVAGNKEVVRELVGVLRENGVGSLV